MINKYTHPQSSLAVQPRNQVLGRFIAETLGVKPNSDHGQRIMASIDENRVHRAAIAASYGMSFQQRRSTPGTSTGSRPRSQTAAQAEAAHQQRLRELRAAVVGIFVRTRGKAR